MSASQREMEKFGESFSEQEMMKARELTWKALDEIRVQIAPGISEEEAKHIGSRTITQMGFQKNWHKVNIRFGVNTTKNFSALSEPETKLQENDIYYIDIGPVWNGYEGDVGQTFLVGNNPRWQKLKQDSEEIFALVRDQWKSKKISGLALYDFAEALAHERGWKLGRKEMSGHRLSDFPHAAYYKGKLDGIEATPSQYAWVLEILLIDDETRRAAFYEDLLF